MLIKCDKIIEKLKDIKIDYKPDVLIGFIRGGVVLTGLLQYKLNVRKINFIDISLYDDEHKPREYVFSDMLNVFNILNKYKYKKI